MGKSRIFPDLVAMRLGEKFLVDTVSKRDRAWVLAKRDGIKLSSRKTEDNEFEIVKIGGPVNMDVPSPILDKNPDLASFLHFKVSQQSERHKKSKRKGLQQLDSALYNTEPCSVYEYSEIPEYIRDIVQQILMHKEPWSVRHWLAEFYPDTDSVADSILKYALLEVYKNKVVNLSAYHEKAIATLDPRYEDGNIVIDYAQRYMSAEIISSICDEFEVDELYCRVKRPRGKDGGVY